MQKISSYLYPNRINVVADVAPFPVRWKIVYQNRIKIYKGVDNVLTLDVKNADQKRIDISGMTLKMSITDTDKKAIATVDVTPGLITGLATATVTASDVELLEDPQFLFFTIYRENEDMSKTVFYADTNFGAIGNMELVGTALTEPTPTKEINIFLSHTNTLVSPWQTFYESECVEIHKPNFIGAVEDESIQFDFSFTSLTATITVQFTKDTVVSTGTVWTDIEVFAVANSTSTLTKTYSFPTYNREWAWARVKYVAPSGRDASFEIVKSNGVYTQVFLRHAGTGYHIGDNIKIVGTHMHGDDVTNDLIITVTDVNMPYQSIKEDGFTWAGAAALTQPDPAGFLPQQGELLTSTGKIDRVIVSLL